MRAGDARYQDDYRVGQGPSGAELRPARHGRILHARFARFYCHERE